MPGGGGHRWEPDQDLPWPSIVVLILVAMNMVVGFVLLYTIDRWANQFVSGEHWYEFRMKGGAIYYLTPRMGWYMDHDVLLTLGGFGLSFLITLLYGVRWHRVR